MPPGAIRTVVLIAGARPNFMKLAPVLKALSGRPTVRTKLVHTGQHYDREMSDAFFEELGIRPPDANLGVGSGSHARQTGRIMIRFERLLAAEPPDIVMVLGDVNSTLACSIVAAKAQVRVAHVEAGLRSFDRSMPEEINRIVTDSLSSVCFTTSQDAGENLRREGHAEGEIHLVGNTMIDTLVSHEQHATADRLERLGVDPATRYALVTLHRPSNVDDPGRLRGVIEALAGLPLLVVFPMHPRTRVRAQRAGVSPLLRKLIVLPPVGYLDSLALQRHASVVITDSGGMQEETTYFGVSCLTFRDNTERPITITHGSNRLIGTDPRRIESEVGAVLKTGRPPRRIPPLWDGKAGERIGDILERIVA